MLTSLNLTRAFELGFRNLSKDGVVSAGGARDRLQEPVSSLMVILRLSNGGSGSLIFRLIWGTVILRSPLATLAEPLGADGKGDS